MFQFLTISLSNLLYANFFVDELAGQLLFPVGQLLKYKQQD